MAQSLLAKVSLGGLWVISGFLMSLRRKRLVGTRYSFRHHSLSKNLSLKVKLLLHLIPQGHQLWYTSSLNQVTVPTD